MITKVLAILYNSLFEVFGAVVCGIVLYTIFKDLYFEFLRNKK